jgi:hypothetical protein
VTYADAYALYVVVKLPAAHCCLCQPQFCLPTPALHTGATNVSLATAATTTAAAILNVSGIPLHNTTIFTPTNDAFAALGLDIPPTDYFNATLNTTSWNVGVNIQHIFAVDAHAAQR